MSYSIDEENRITLTRGDTLKMILSLEQKDTHEPYIPVEGDRIRFAVKHDKMLKDKSDYEDKNPLIIKNIPIDTMLLRLDPEDTKDLPFGKYVYDIEITFISDGSVDTFIEANTFRITKEVH